MLPTLLALSLRGTLIALLVWVADRACARIMTASWRRVWWLLVPLSFLLPLDLSFHACVPEPIPVDNSLHSVFPANPVALLTSWPFLLEPATPTSLSFWLLLIWLAGVALGSLRILIPTIRVHRRWSRHRLSTNPQLLNLLEDAKLRAGVTAPIGLIVSDQVAAPALLGWLRPRLLLPASFATSLPSAPYASSATPATFVDLRAVLLHELAHFKYGDLPLNWLFAILRVLHWFNPAAWLAGAAWARFREEAADECAIRWLGPTDGHHYGDVLLKLLDHCSGGDTPSGALAITESLNTLKRRIHMIRHYPARSSRPILATVLTLLVAALAILLPVRGTDADADGSTKQAVASIQTWLGEIDSGDYAKSWTDSSPFFQKAITSDKWVAALKSVRAPLGKLLERKLASALLQDSVPGSATKGQYVIAQFDTSFENLKYARETVTFEKDADGTWRADGYYIKPQ